MLLSAEASTTSGEEHEQADCHDPAHTMIDIQPARVPDDLDAVRDIFREYADSLGTDLSFQSFDEELASLPVKYAPPTGAILLAWQGKNIVGSVALRAFDYDICEMKRLYVRPEGRGQQLGRRLAQALVHAARNAGYKKMRLDTLPTMHEAQMLYAESACVWVIC